MKLNAKTEKAAEPARPEWVVAVDITKPLQFSLMANEPVDGLRAGEGIPLLGYNLTYDKGEVIPIAYGHGNMPYCLREAEATGDYSQEVLFTYPAPATIQEINMSEYPAKTFTVILTNAAVIPRPVPEGKVIQFTPPQATAAPLFTPLTGREIDHPATIELRERNCPGKQLLLTFEPTEKLA